MKNQNKQKFTVNLPDYNAHWTETIRKMNKQLTSVVSPFQNPELRKMLDGISTPSFSQLMSEQLSNSSFAAKAMIDNQNMISKLAQQRPAFSETVRKLAEASKLSFDDHRQSLMHKTYASMANTMIRQAFEFPKIDMDAHLKSFADLTQFSSLAKVHAEAIQSASQMSGLASFQALAKLNNNPFLTGAGLNISKGELSDVNDFDIEELDVQISKELVTVSDFNALSDRTKDLISYFYHFYLLPFTLSILAAIIMIDVETAKNELVEKKSASEVRKFARSSSEFVNATSLNGYRVTKADNLNFRVKPGMKTHIITTLPIGTLVEVIDKSNRAWLFVEVEIEGELQRGYVSRRYTVYFK